MNHRTFHNYAAFSDAVCDLVIAQVTNPPAEGPYGIALSGGNTPRPIYERLVAVLPPANDRFHILQVDERLVAQDHPDSNYRHISPLCAHLKLPAQRFLHVHPNLALHDAANRYAAQVDAFFAAGGQLTLALLGIGTDGHTASLFDPLALDAARNAWAIAVRHGGFDRVSLGLRALRQAQHAYFLVAGEEKQPVIRQTLADPASTIAGRVGELLPHAELWFSPCVEDTTE